MADIKYTDLSGLEHFSENIKSIINEKANISLLGSYYTKAQVDNLLGGKADTSHGTHITSNAQTWSGVKTFDSPISFGTYGGSFSEDIRSTWRESIFGTTSNNAYIRTVRTDKTIDGFSEIYGSGITWSTADTHGYLSVSYNSRKAWIAGGNGNALNWSTHIITGENISSQSVNYANIAGSVTWTNVSGRPTNLSAFTDDILSGNYLPLSGGTITTKLSTDKPTYNNAPLKFDKSYNDNDLNNYRYRPWFSGQDLVNNHGYGLTISAGLYRNPGVDNGGFYLGMGWDDRAYDKIIYFEKTGKIIADTFKGNLDGNAARANVASVVADCGNSTSTTFAYSKSGLNYGDYSWLAGWNGYELRAVNKNQFAQASHTHTKAQITDFTHSHDYLPLTGGTIDGNISIGHATNNSWKQIGFNRLNSSNVNEQGFIGNDISSMAMGMTDGYIRVGKDLLTFINNDSTKNILHSGNSSVSKSGETLTVNINGTSCSLTNTDTNTWRGITDDYGGTSTSVSLSQKGGNSLYNSSMIYKGAVNTNFVNLTNTAVNANGYINLSTGIYTVSRTGYSDTLIHFGSSGSTSAIQLLCSYSDDARLCLRKTIDSNCISGGWKELAFLSDIPTIYDWAKAATKPTYAKSDVGLGNVDNTADANKNVNRAKYLETKYTDGSKWYGDSYKAYIQWETTNIAKLKVDNYYTKTDYADSATTATTAASTNIINVTSCRPSSNSKLWDDATVDACKVKFWDVYNDGGPYTYGNILEINGIDSHWKPQLWFDAYSGQMRVRNRDYNATKFNSWRTILDEVNYTSYTVKKDGTGASGAWSINVTGSSGSCTGNAATASNVAWSGVTGKPTILTANGSTGNVDINTIKTNGTYYIANGASNSPGSYGEMLCMRNVDTNAQIYVPYSGGNMKYRGGYDAGGYYAWRNILDDTNYTTYCTPDNIGAATASHNHAASEITSGTLSVSRGGTGATTFTSGAALIGSGTSAVTTRSITNMTNFSYIDYNSNLMTTNTLAYWNGAYNSSGASNLTYCNKGAFGSAATKSTTSSITEGSAALVTSGAVYTGLAGKSDTSHGHETLVQGSIHNIKSAKYNWALSSGTWYRVMESDSTSVADATGDLIVYLHNAGSPVTFKLTFGLSYHNNPFLQCNWYTTWSSNQISKARIVYKTEYGNQRAYLELYSDSSITHETTFSFKGTGWSFMTPTATTEAYADNLNSKLEINIGADKAVYSHTIVAPKFDGSSTSVLDSSNSSKTTFAYGKSGLNYADYTWLAGWNGYELRAVNKSQFAQASHSHSYLPLSGGVINTTLSTNLPTYSNSPLKFDCTYNNNDSNNSRYRPWFAGEDLVNNYGYGVTASVGIYRDPGFSSGGLYIGCGWDGNANTVMWKFSRAGGLYSTAFYQTSDERLKDFQDDIQVDLDKIRALPKKYFTWKDSDNKNSQIGTSAQAIQEIYPELVSESDGYLSVAYDKLSVIALKAVDELYTKNQELEERLKRIEKMLNI